MPVRGPADRFVQASLQIFRSVNTTGFAGFVGFISALPSTSAMTDATEVTGTSYARQPCAFGAMTGTSRTISNPSNITWTGTPGPWNSGNDILYFGIWDLVTGGNLWWADLVNPVLKVPGPSTILIPAGLLTLTAPATTV